MLKTIKTKIIKEKVEKEIKPRTNKLDKNYKQINIIVEWGSFIIEL